MSGGTLDRKRISVTGERAGCVVRALAEAQGLSVVDAVGDDVELCIVEVQNAEELRARGRSARPIIAVVRRRLRSGEAKAFLDAGARAVIDAESSVLDVAFTVSDLLFGTRVHQRRYSRAHGGMTVRVRTLDQREEIRAQGELVDLSRPAAFVLTGARIPEGAAVELELRILGRVVPLRGRVAFARERDDREGVAIEFALGDFEVAPKLFALCEEEAPALRASSDIRSDRPPSDRPGVRAALSSAR